MPRRFQFSLRGLLALTLGIGVLLGTIRFVVATPAFSAMAFVVLAFLVWARTSLGR
jgi:hypothetical protein